MATAHQSPPALEQACETIVANDAMPYKLSARVTLESDTVASMVCRSLSVDPELRPEVAARRLAVDGKQLLMEFEAVDVRTLRASVGTLCDLLALCVRTAEAFPPLGA